MDNAKLLRISQRMEEVRSGLEDGVEEIFESTRTLSDWRHYVKTFPWTCMAGAAAIGFCLVPKRVEMIAAGTDTLEQLNRPAVQSNPTSHANSGVSGTLLGLLASSLGREAVAMRP